MEAFNIYLAGVGGQGIGLLSEIILRAGDHAGLPVKGVDTHGLAQRGGIVKSQIRMGTDVHAPLIPAGTADLVIALERHEALRAMNLALRDEGALIYYNAVWQPLDVRLGREAEITAKDLENAAHARRIKSYQVFDPSLPDARMQNIAILAVIAKHQLIPGIQVADYTRAMEDLMAGSMLTSNQSLFESRLAG
jgi:indolepyruvate ferredoxin oxidoreductase beta subunit